MRTETAFVLPQHHFNISYDVEELRDASKETELFALVLHGFFLNANIGVHERKY